MTTAALSHLIQKTGANRRALRVSRHLLAKTALIGAMAMAGLNALAGAEPLVPEVTFPAEQATLAARNIDVLNLVAGMTPDEARNALLALPAPETLAEKKTFFSVASRGAKV